MFVLPSNSHTTIAKGPLMTTIVCCFLTHQKVIVKKTGLVKGLFVRHVAVDMRLIKCNTGDISSSLELTCLCLTDCCRYMVYCKVLYFNQSDMIYIVVIWAVCFIC